MVHEFGSNEITLEDIDLKAAPNSNGRFSKNDVIAENATFPEVTPCSTASMCILEVPWPNVDGV